MVRPVVKRKQQEAHAPLYGALSKALGECLPLPAKVTVRLELYLWQRLRDELGRQYERRWRRLPFDECPIRLELWGSKVYVWPK